MLFQDFYKGRAFDAYTYFGAHIEGTGVWFRVYAPAAKAVYVIGDFSGWNRIRMDHGYDGGVFTAYVEGAKAGQTALQWKSARHLHRSLRICTSTGLQMRNGWQNGTNAMTNQ